MAGGLVNGKLAGGCGACNAVRRRGALVLSGGGATGSEEFWKAGAGMVRQPLVLVVAGREWQAGQL